MEQFITTLFAVIGLAATVICVCTAISKLHEFFKEDLPQIKMNQDEIYQKIHLLQQRIKELEEKVND